MSYPLVQWLRPPLRLYFYLNRVAVLSPHLDNNLKPIKAVSDYPH